MTDDGVVRAERTPLGALRDNVEAVAFALVMALLLRAFCVEVFKIPTASMYPTLRGDDVAKGTVGDRIVVDKWAYLASDPERWDVPVFRFPLDRSRNFIKRIAILPGEEFRMERGDLWVRRAGTSDPYLVPRKPRDVRETLYVPVFPPTDAKEPDLLHFEREGDDDLAARVVAAISARTTEERRAALRAIEEADGVQALPSVRSNLARLPITHAAYRDVSALDARLSERARLREYWRGGEGSPRRWRLESYRRFAFAGGGHESVEYAFQITDSTHASEGSRSTSGSPVVDVRVRLDVEATSSPAAPTSFQVEWQPGDGRRAVLRLATAGERDSVLETKTRRQTLAARLAVGRRVALELEYVDGDARAWVDGEEVAVLADDLDVDAAVAALDDESGGPQRLRIAAEGGSLVVDDVRVDHDLYYWSGRNQPPNEPRQRESIVVPPDSYFMLGDNTSSSHDSRRWTAHGVRVKPGRPDGLTEIWWDSQTSWTAEPPDEDDPPELGGKRKVTDLDGIVRTWHAQEETETLNKRVRFVTRDLIVGRAFFALVFWPLDEIARRFRLIH